MEMLFFLHQNYGLQAIECGCVHSSLPAHEGPLTQLKWYVKTKNCALMLVTLMYNRHVHILKCSALMNVSSFEGAYSTPIGTAHMSFTRGLNILINTADQQYKNIKPHVM